MTLNIQTLKIPLSYKTLKILFVISVLLMWATGLFESFQNGKIIWEIARNESGELAWNLLIFIMFLGLGLKLFPKLKLFQQFSPLRKEAGIIIFLIIIGHLVFHFLKTDVLGDWPAMLYQTFQHNWVILLGSIAGLLMVPLFITSNRLSVKKLGYSAWKRLHLLGHLIFILAALHTAFTDYPDDQAIDFSKLFILGLYLVGYFYLGFKKYSIKSQ